MLSQKIIGKFEKQYDMSDLEIYVYYMSDMLDNLKNDLNDIIYGNGYINTNDIDLIDAINTLTHNIMFLENEIDNKSDVLIIDTPNDDDIFTLIKFNENGDINNHCEIQSNIDCLQWENEYNNSISILSDCMQFFKLIDTSETIEKYKNNWIYGIDININYDYLSRVINNWLNN